MSELERPVFCKWDPDEITQRDVEFVENKLGKTLFPAQPERIFVDFVAYVECLIRQQIQEAAEQTLTEYARDAALDQSGNNIGCPRLDAQAASCAVQISLQQPLGYVHEIAAGLKLKTRDDLFTFETTESCFFSADSDTATCEAVCTTTGPDANGYLPGSLVLAETVVNIKEATNVTVTALGAEEEEDDHYRERIPETLESFSCAGPAGAYRYWAKTAHQSVVDVSAQNAGPGIVRVVPLTSSGAPTEKLLQAVADIFNDKCRPMTVQVKVEAPTAVHFSLSAQLSIYANSDRESILAAANRKILEYKKTLAQKMGKDIVPSQIVALLQLDGVYSVELESPGLLKIDGTSYPVLDSWNINIGSIIYE